jgi:hypothetical protein
VGVNQNLPSRGFGRAPPSSDSVVREADYHYCSLATKYVQIRCGWSKR